MTRWLFLAACLSLLAACAGPAGPGPGNGPTPEQAWQIHKAKLASLKDWQFNGRLVFDNGVEVWSLKVRWQQNANGYNIMLIGPLGSGQVQLRGRDGDGVTLRNADNESFRADNVESLLYQQTGLRMPVSGLRYWILGLPDAAVAEEKYTQLDGQGRLLELKQSDWHVEYLDYQQVTGLSLPEKMILSSGEIEVRLIIDYWTYRPSA